MMRLTDFPRRSDAPQGLIERVSVEARCCQQQFGARRIHVFGLFRIVRCPRCARRAMILEATTDRDWSRWGGDLAHRRFGARTRRSVDA